MAEYGRYLGSSYGDLVVGDYIQRQSSRRYCIRIRTISGALWAAGWSTLGYAVGQIFCTHSDSDATQFNCSEIVNNSAAAAISNAWYADNRTTRDAVSKLGVQIGVDMASNILKELWPIWNRSFPAKRTAEIHGKARHR